MLADTATPTVDPACGDASWISENSNAIHLLKQNPEKIDWKKLSKNPNAIPLLEQNVDKIDWWWQVSCNPSIFEIDYEALKARIEPIEEELMQKCYHPNRLFYYLEKYNYDIGDEEYMDESN